MAALALSSSRHLPGPPQLGTGCLVKATDFEVPLSAGQAGVASTIAGVAHVRALPARAVTIAYATALQESDLENLPYGDRDSVGIFQQRPSQGWGTRQELLNPIYATTQFFAALAKIPGYLNLPVYKAAQDVQHSADGSAYGQYAGEGAALADGFVGNQARSVYCWYGNGISGHSDLAAADRDLVAAFGGARVRYVGDPVMAIHVSSHTAGWGVAFWLVTHAASYHLRTVRYAGYQWIAAHGQRGWRKDRPSRHWPGTPLTVAVG